MPAVSQALKASMIEWLQLQAHRYLGWHWPDEGEFPRRFDGFSFHATCRMCGKDIMLDSQGNWF